MNRFFGWLFQAKYRIVETNDGLFNVEQRCVSRSFRGADTIEWNYEGTYDTLAKAKQGINNKKPYKVAYKVVGYYL